MLNYDSRHLKPNIISNPPASHIHKQHRPSTAASPAAAAVCLVQGEPESCGEQYQRGGTENDDDEQILLAAQDLAEVLEQQTETEPSKQPPVTKQVRPDRELAFHLPLHQVHQLASSIFSAHASLLRLGQSTLCINTKCIYPGRRRLPAKMSTWYEFKSMHDLCSNSIP